MGIYINEIQLKNWFNFLGEYEQNTFKFNEGLNIIVGDNNAGKTKLHNAIRFILKNRILLENPLISKVEETEILNNNIKEVFNKRVFLSMTNGASEKMGVVISFETSTGTQKTNYILRKEFVCRKDIEDLKIIELTKSVKIVDPITKKPRLVHDEFEVIANKIIPEKYQDFFFLEGEQLGLLTPLQGPKLRTTINSIVHLDELDKLEQRVTNFVRSADRKKVEILEEENKDKKDTKSKLEEILELKKENEENEDAMNINRGIYELNKEIVEQTKRAAEEIKKNKDLLKTLEVLKGNITKSESALNEKISTYISQLMDNSVFSVNSLYDDALNVNKLTDHIEKVKGFLSERRTEMNSKLTALETKMIQSLEKSQPKVEILNQMIEERTCYVCSHEINEDSVKYMKEKLIPFFNEELDNDEEIIKLDRVRDFLTTFKIHLGKYFNKNETYFEDIENKIIQLAQDKTDKEKKLSDFFDKNGSVENPNDVDLVTYERALKEKETAEIEINRSLLTIQSNNDRIRELEENTNPPIGDESERYKTISKLASFSTDLNEVLTKIKKAEYQLFTEKLQSKATSRFQKFMEENEVARHHRIVVKITNEGKNEYNFKINVLDELDQIVENPGQADQALRRVSVVFGLLDCTDSKKGFPFIADAPISKLSQDTKKRFFLTLLDDKALSQCIILNMDLWSSDKKNITELGHEVLDLIKQRPNSTFITIVNKKKGVEIDYLKG